MEENSIHHFSLFLDTPIYLLPEEKSSLIHAPSSKEQEKTAPQEEEIPVEISQGIQELVYDGGFEKGVLVVYEENYLADGIKELLFRILDAVGCSLKDIALAGAEALSGTGMEQIEALNPVKVIVFGQPKHSLLQLKKKTYDIQMIEETEYLFADNLELISENKELKKLLWASLQTLFNVK